MKRLSKDEARLNRLETQLFLNVERFPMPPCLLSFEGRLEMWRRECYLKVLAKRYYQRYGGHYPGKPPNLTKNNFV